MNIFTTKKNQPNFSKSLKSNRSNRSRYFHLKRCFQVLRCLKRHLSKWLMAFRSGSESVLMKSSLVNPELENEVQMRRNNRSIKVKLITWPLLVSKIVKYLNINYRFSTIFMHISSIFLNIREDSIVSNNSSSEPINWLFPWSMTVIKKCIHIPYVT